ncbi:hypothetical protein ACLB2K_026418 [Fragaria x ananassa]
MTKKAADNNIRVWNVDAKDINFFNILTFKDCNERAANDAQTMGEILYACDDSDMQLIGKFLSFASRGDRVGLNQMLIQGVSPDVQDYDNRTAMHLAASEGHTPIVELLVCYRANVNLQDRWKRTQEEMVLITEYLPKGNLEDILNQRTRLDVHTALRYALDIARLIQKCTSGDPSDRPPFEDIIGILEEEVVSLGRACPLVC